MEHNFEITISLNGKQQTYNAEVVPSGYTYKIVVRINDIEVWFEPDEERNYRAVINGTAIDKMQEGDIPIIKALGEHLQQALKD